MEEKRSVAELIKERLDDRTPALPQPFNAGSPPSPPPKPIPHLRDRISRVPEVRLANGFAVPYGCGEHVRLVELIEGRERAARAIAVQQARADFEAFELNLKQAELEAAEVEAAVAAAKAAGNEDAVFALSLRAANIRRSAAHRRREVETGREAIERAKVFAKSPLPVTVDAVRKTRARILSELGLSERALAKFYASDGMSAMERAEFNRMYPPEGE